MSPTNPTAVLTFILSCFVSSLFAQNLAPKFEQLNQKLSNSPQAVLNELLASPISDQKPLLAAQYHYTLSKTYLVLVYPKESLQAAEKALSLLENQQATWLYHLILITQSQAMELSGLAAEALPLAKQALTWAENQGDHAMTIDALIALGYIENTLGNSINALSVFMRAYNMAPNNDVVDAVTTKSAIASSVALVYEYRREDRLAIPFFQEAVDYHRNNKNLLDLSIALYGLGRANKNIGKKELGQEQLQESLEISRAIDDEQGVAYALKELAPLLMQAEEFEQAESMLNEAATLFAKSGNQFMLLDIHKTLTNFYLAKNDSLKAQLNIEQAKQYLNEQRMPIQAISLAELESQVNASQGLFEPAYKQLLGTISKKQQLLSESSTQRLHELRTQFELETQAKENSLLAKENAEQKLYLLKQEQSNQLLMIGLLTAAGVVILLVLMALRSRQQKQQLFKLANFDQLTGLANRNHIMGLLKAQKNQLSSEQNMQIVMLDLDHFKQINDQLGHEVGDHVLKYFGQLCNKNITSPNLVGRFGGEEFLLALVNCSNEDASETIDSLRSDAQSISDKIKQDIATDCPSIGFSAGISNCRNDTPLNECIKNADLAMYQAKNNGRNRTVVSAEV